MGQFILNRSASQGGGARELRVHPRVAVDIPIELNAHGRKRAGSKPVKWAALANPSSRTADVGDHVVANLSRGGMSVDSTAVFELGQILNFHLPLPNGRAVKGRAAVCWQQNLGYRSSYGLKIVSMGFFSRQHLGQYVHPGRVGALKATDLLLQFITAIVIIGVARELVSWDWVMNAVVSEDFPFLMLAGAGSLVAWLMWLQVRY